VRVMGRWSVKAVDVRADGMGLSWRPGTALLASVADRAGLTGGLCEALEATRERRSGHEPGRVFCDLAVTLADGGRCVSDVAALAGQSSLFGDVASVSTARRVAPRRRHPPRLQTPPSAPGLRLTSPRHHDEIGPPRRWRLREKRPRDPTSSRHGETERRREHQPAPPTSTRDPHPAQPASRALTDESRLSPLSMSTTRRPEP
jgi:hypothetical protein